MPNIDDVLAYAAAKKAKAEAAANAAPAINGNGHVAVVSGDDTNYGLGALADECAKVAGASVGTRNDRLNTAAVKLSGLVSGGHLTEPTMRVNLEAAGRAAGLSQAEIDLVLRDNANGAIAVGKARPRSPAIRRITPVETAASVDGYQPEPEPATAALFWAARAELVHIQAFARARRACPWAVLGVVLARVVVAVPPWVVLPPLVGDEASLNVFVALVSASGGGKGASEAAAAAGVDVGRITAAGVGSGEGLAHLFMRRSKEGVDQFRDAVLMKAAEIDTLAALGDRKGATLLPELRKAWSGEALGFAYADPTKALPLPAHHYRLCLVAGVQPGRAGWVLDDAAGGTPQRFLWLPATDPDAPDLAPSCPVPWVWKGPSWPMADAFTGHVVMEVAQVAKDVIDKARLDRLRDQGEPLDGHALLARLKAGAALAILAGRHGVTEEDWELSGVIAEVSDATRAGVVEHLRREAKERNTGRAMAEAARAITISDQQEGDALAKACSHILRKLRANPEGMTGADLRRGFQYARRGAVDPALDKLAELGQIEAVAAGGNGSRGLRWKVKP